MMLSNLPPGVTDSMIPGNRPEDQEVEVDLIFSIGEIDDLASFVRKEEKLPQKDRHELYYTILNIVEQLEEEFGEWE